MSGSGSTRQLSRRPGRASASTCRPLYIPTLDGLHFEVFLQKLREAYPEEKIVLVLDGAGAHRNRSIRWPEGLVARWLPAYSPELQPAERLWPLVDAPLANRAFDSIDQLDATLSEQCVRLTEQPERIRSLTLFHWWPGGTDHEPDS